MSRTTAAAAATGLGVVFRPPFTASQWEELEHQALIFKYFIAGIPVPHELLLPIRRSYESMTARLYSHPSLGYCSYYGKKLDPEPGRCRRTDGKKWRCSKDAFQDSKYCERHMHRGRNRSRKHVETSQAVPPPPSSFSTERSVTPSSAGRGGGASHELFFHSIGTSPTKVQVDPVSYGMSAMGTAKEFRYLYEPRAELDKCHLFSEAFGSLRASPSTHSAVDISYLPVAPPLPSFPPSKEQIDSFLSGSNCVRLQPMQDPGHQHHQNSFFGSDFIEQPVKSVQPLLPFFDEWPRTHNSWSDLEDERASQAAFTTTQLSISIPMVSSDFSTTTSLSQNGSSSP